MKRFAMRGLALTAASLAAALWTVVATAGPALPKDEVGASIQSMAKLQRLALSIAPMTEALKDAQVSVEALNETVSEALTESGFTVTEEAGDDVPRLVIQLMTSGDKAFPGAVSYCAVLALRQPVGLKRIEHEMEATTYATYRVALEMKENLHDSIFTTTRDMVTEFIWTQSRSREALAEEG